MLANSSDSLHQKGYAEVNGIKMYYEIYGQGDPLVLIHGGGSTIQSNFGQLIPQIASYRQIIAMELQAHGRTEDRDIDSSFEQDADDVVALLHKLKIKKADFLGFSNGGTSTLQVAIRHPEIVGKIILCAALAKRTGVPVPFWDMMKQADLANMPTALIDAYLAVNPSREGLRKMHDRDAKRMVYFKDIPDEQLIGIQAQALIIIGDKDVILPEHAIELHRQISGSELAIIPGLHGECLGELTTLKTKTKQVDFVVPMILRFLQ